MSDAASENGDLFDDDDVETNGAVESANPHASQNDDDEDDDNVVTKRRAAASAPDNGDLNDDEPDLGDEDDLFGEDGDDQAEDQTAAERNLNDEELDSGDDMDRRDRIQSQPDQELEDTEQKVLDISIPRHPVPRSSDNELYLLKVPQFMAFEPKSFVLEKWQPPTTDHHSKTEPSETFSSYKTAQTTLRWRHSPSDPSQIQSNARVLRWSDGSLTLQLGSDPLNQYEFDAKPLAPPQHNPPKPTPTAVKDRRGGSTAYDPSRDSFTYLCSPHPTLQTVRVTNKVTAGLTLMPARGASDDALERLQASLAAAANARQGVGATVFSLQEDPEEKKRQAEVLEKEREKQLRLRERQEERRRERDNRAFGRSGLSRSGGYGGYRAGNSGHDEEGGSRRSKPNRARRDEYSDDEDFQGRRRTREDEYDEEDDFIAGSDEEPEIDEEEDIDEGIEAHRPSRRDSPKRGHAEQDEDDEEEVVASSRSKRRRVVDEEDED
ncbi:Leo1-like protein-domain-containing protein [Phyllosticta citribraziliensis]